MRQANRVVQIKPLLESRQMIIMVVLLMTSFLYSWAQETRKPVVRSYQLDVSFFPDAKMDYAGLIEVLYGQRPGWNKVDSVKSYPHMKCKAVVIVDFGTSSRDSLSFYLHSELRVHWMKLGESQLKFSQKIVFYPSNYSMVANQVTVKLSKVSGTHPLSIAYGGVFNPSYASSPSNYMRIDTQGAYLRSYGYSLWFPVFVEARSNTQAVNFTEVKIKTPKPFRGVFTGQRVKEYVDGNLHISLWCSEQTDIRDAQIAVRPYQINHKSGTYLYYLDNNKSKAACQGIHVFISRLDKFYSDHYKKVQKNPQLHIAELPNFASGISSGNMVGMTSGQWQKFSLEDKEVDLKLLLAHELVHGFVQVEVDINNPLAALVVEGFPSYFHLPALGEILGEEFYQKYMRGIEKSYLKKKETGKTRRGSPLPQEKPILSLTWTDIGIYKDTFILNDRVRLFLNYIRTKLGEKRFRKFTLELCNSSHLELPAFNRLLEKFLPGSIQDMEIWLETNQYPPRFYLK